jgi:hypothetical protein
MKNSNDNIGNRSRDLPVCSAEPQPLRHRVPLYDKEKRKIFVAEWKEVIARCRKIHNEELHNVYFSPNRKS